MIKSLLATLSAASISFLVAAEPSAFGAGNLDNPNPYGLTSSEQHVLKNKDALKKVVLKSNNQANEVDSLRERIDGFQSIIESLSRKSHENKKSLGSLEEKNMKDIENANEYEKRLGQSVELNAQLIAKNLSLLQELRSLTHTIETTYVTKKEFNALINSVNDFKKLVAKELKSKSKSKPKVTSLDGMTRSEVAAKAQAFYNKQYYTKGIEYYTYLIQKNYKPANAHFMIGQMKFKRKNYSEAISYYKKSASLYEKASYMPELLLHTAISMDKTNDTKNAKVFYNAILMKYPNSKEANKANENLLAL